MPVWFNISNILSSATLVGMVFIVFNYFRNPDINAKTQIELIKQSCRLKHSTLDDQIILIKDNHLKHIEANIRDLKDKQIKILTILEERLPNKQQ